MSQLSRRNLLAASTAAATGGAVAAGLALAATGRSAVGAEGAPPDPVVQPADGLRTEPFHGPHQAGIATAPQTHAAFLGIDLMPGSGRDAAVRMLTLLTDDAARLTQGRPALGDTEPELALRPGRLTVTAGFGPRMFEILARDGERPPSVAELPVFSGDRLEPRWGQSDLLLQVCSDDQVTLAHTVRMLVKDARSFGSIRWLQRGFTSPGATPAGTARNLMGQVDGTVNPKPDTPEFDRVVWATGPSWFAGGTVLVLRRIQMNLETWDAFDRDGKEQIMGRRLEDGAPLTGTVETDVPDLRALDANGFTVIEPNAHIRLAHATTESEKLLRRPYSYDDGVDAAGRPDVGLLFAAYQADADAAFVTVQRRLATDLLNKWITHVGSAVYAVPPGVAEGEYWGRGLVEG